MFPRCIHLKQPDLEHGVVSQFLLTTFFPLHITEVFERDKNATKEH